MLRPEASGRQARSTIRSRVLAVGAIAVAALAVTTVAVETRSTGGATAGGEANGSGACLEVQRRLDSAAGSVRAVVLNATHVPLLAQKTKGLLFARLGIEVVRTGNSAYVGRRDRVEYAVGCRALAQSVSQLLPHGAHPARLTSLVARAEAAGRPVDLVVTLAAR